MEGILEDAEELRLRTKGFFEALGEGSDGVGVLGAGRNEVPGPVSADGSGAYRGSSRYLEDCAFTLAGCLHFKGASDGGQDHL